MSVRNVSNKKHLTPEVCARAKRLYGRYPWNDVCEMLNISTSTLVALKRRNFEPARRKLRPIPHDFALIADTMNVDDLRKHYQCSPVAVRRWIAETKPARPKCGQKRMPIPADFAERSRGALKKDLAAHYGVHRQTIGKWLRETAPAQRPRAVGWVDNYVHQVAA